MKIQTKDLTSVALDYAVLLAKGYNEKDITIGTYGPLFGKGWLGVTLGFGSVYQPSTNWAQGGTIIEREKIATYVEDGPIWTARYSGTTGTCYGDTPLIAAMRCYIASKLGDTVEIPAELL